MTIIKIKKFFMLLTLFLGIMVVHTACQQMASNPDSEKVKTIQEEVTNMKLQQEKMAESMAEQKRDLEIIKQHLIPSYKAQINDLTDTATGQSGQSTNEEVTTVDVTVDNNGTKTTIKETFPVVAPGENNQNRPAPVTTQSNVPKAATTNTLPKQSVMPASKVNNNTDNRTPPRDVLPKDVNPRNVPREVPSSRNVPDVKVPQPNNPEPPSPAKANARNINYTFSDIMDHPYRQYIGVLSTIGGILDRQNGKFEPEEVITRAEFLTWLCKTYNAYHRNNVPIVKSSAGKYDVFDDVPPSHRAYPYIQGLANAGLLVSFNEERILRPDEPITREELIAYTEFIQRGKPGYQLKQITPQFCNLYINTFVTDGKNVTLDYSQMIYRNINESDFINKTFHIFEKKIVILLPQKAVTRAQAAASLCFLNGMEPYRLGFILKDDYEDYKKKIS